MRVIALSMILALLVSPCFARAENAEAAAAQASLPTVTVAEATMAEMQARVPLSGTLVARQEVQVYAQVQGFEVIELLVEAGDVVTAGQLLARLNDATVKAQLQQAEAEYQRAEAGVGQARSQISSAEAALTQAMTALSRARALRRSGNTSQAALDQAVAAEASAQAQAASAGDGLAVAEAALAQADAARSIARLNLERTQITAPVAGLVVARNAQLGAIAASGGQPLFTLVADGEIELEAEVIETALRDLRPGLPAALDVAGVGSVAGQVRLVPASVDPLTRLGLVRIALDNDAALRTGLFASGAIITQQRQALSVPATAVLSDSAGDRVQLVRDGVVETRPVTAGLLWQGRREIAEGLAPGDPVMARSGAFFRDGDRVNVITPDLAEAAQP